MGQKSKLTLRKKLQIIKEHETKGTPYAVLARKSGMNLSSVRNLITIYKNEGEDGLRLPAKRLTSEEKLAAVLEAYAGTPYKEVCQKYGIRYESELSLWVKKYHDGGTLEDGRSMRHVRKISVHKKDVAPMENEKRTYTVKARKTTLEERVKIVKECASGACSCKQAASKYDLTYAQITYWVRKYKRSGNKDASLDDNRGIHKEIVLDSLSDEQRELAELKMKEAENHSLRIENEFLKKVQQFERRGRNQ